jgi:predicted DNA-binding transcriptional regulator AlpA
MTGRHDDPPHRRGVGGTSLDLDRLLADLDRLPTDQLPLALGALEAAKAHLWTRLTTSHSPSTRPVAVPAPSDGTDRTVDVREAARLLGMSPSWVYRHARELPFAHRVGSRAVRFSVSGIRRYLARRCSPWLLHP